MPFDERFNRVALLAGSPGLDCLRQSSIAVFGLGGVGSWTAEALARTGVGHITLVDADRFVESNINRQSGALNSTLGRNKTDVMAQRLRDINPDINLTLHTIRYDETTASQFDLSTYDVVIDAIDSLKDKALLIINATSADTVLLSSMGAALKMDPSKIEIAEFWKVKGDPLAAALRSRFRRNSTFPKRKFQCVFSQEHLKNHDLDSEKLSALDDKPLTYGKVAVNGAICHITAIFGMMLAGLALKRLLANCAE